MAFKRYANALSKKSNIHFDEWMEVLRTQGENIAPKDYTNRVAKTVLRKCDPKQYILSHATIVASVDTYAPTNVKLGKHKINGFEIDRRFPDYKITPETKHLVNNNKDCWARSLLLSTYRTFIGAPNYLEHIQLPELSKGFIVDAVARDIGISCYIDILVATDRKHEKLVQDILNGSLNAFSMGCISLFTICTKCGNVAADETQVCPCVQYEGKGSTYTDETGSNQEISELIGHVSVPNSNQFIEASWVGKPAFEGAVRRNFLEPGTVVASKIQNAVKVSKTRVQIPSNFSHAASLRIAQGEDQGQSDFDVSDLSPSDGPEEEEDTTTQDSGDSGESGDQGGSDGSADTKTDDDKEFDELVEKIQERLMNAILDKVDEKLEPKPEDVGTVKPASVDLESGNDNLVHASYQDKLKKTFPNRPDIVKWALGMKRSIEASDNFQASVRDLITLSWINDRVNNQIYSQDLYLTALKLGSIKNFPSERSYLSVCSTKLSRKLTEREVQFFKAKGRIASLAKFDLLKS